jgi:hypothetical protein
MVAGRHGLSSSSSSDRGLLRRSAGTGAAAQAGEGQIEGSADSALADRVSVNGVRPVGCLSRPCFAAINSSSSHMAAARVSGRGCAQEHSQHFCVCVEGSFDLVAITMRDVNSRRVPTPGLDRHTIRPKIIQSTPVPPTTLGALPARAAVGFTGRVDG